MASNAVSRRYGTASDCLPARAITDGAVPWVPLTNGRSFKPLRYLRGNRGFAELLRLEPGAAMPLHRHTGEVHAFNLQGSRRLCTGELIGPGDYVYEPPGNTDWWKVEGDEPLIVFVVVMGAVENLTPDGTVTQRIAADDLRQIYLAYCAEHSMVPVDLNE